jgi:cold shock protein
MTGKIKFFNQTKQFGFITTDSGDVFFHETEIKSPGKIEKGDEVTFEMKEGKKGPMAVNIMKS